MSTPATTVQPPATAGYPELMLRREVATTLRISGRSVSRLIELKPVRIGRGALRWKRGEVLAYLQDREAAR
jgi:predicted DNA-binding transcriptional regulator AlpA